MVSKMVDLLWTLSNGCSNSDIEAQQSAASLQEHIEQQVEGSSDLAARLEQLQLPADAIQPGELTSTPPSVSSDEQAPAAGDTTPTRAPSPPPIAPTDGSIPDADPSIEATFEVVLLTTRVYDRVKDREIDAMSTVSTNRSRAWSILSGLSLAQVSAISVIKLPLHDSELRRFRALAEQYGQEALYENEDRPRGYGIIPGSLRRINKELVDLKREPLSYIAAGPIGDDLVFNVFLPDLLCN
jgi:hypothetical protein